MTTTALVSAQESMGQDAMAVPAAGPQATASPVPVAANPDAVAQEAFYRITAPSAGTYVLAVPTTLPIRIRVDGDVVVDQTQQRNIGAQEFTRALFALSAGEHVVTITGNGPGMRAFGEVLFNKVGGLPQNFAAVAQAIDGNVAAQVLNASAQAGAAQPGQAAPGGQAASGGGRAPFMIGGSGSRLGRTGGAVGGTVSGGGASSGGGTQMAGMMRSTTDRGTASSSSGGGGSAERVSLGSGVTLGSSVSDSGNTDTDTTDTDTTDAGTPGNGGTPTVGNGTPVAGGGMGGVGGGGPSIVGTPVTDGGVTGTPTPVVMPAPTSPVGTPSPAPVTPAPVTPAPVTPAPVVTPGTPTPNPAVPNPAVPVVTPTPTTPAPIPPTGTAAASPLLPPRDVAVNEAVAIVAGATAEGAVASSGQTLFGMVQSPEMFDTVRVQVAPSGRVTDVDVGPSNGQFAVRLHPDDLSQGPVTVTMTAMLSGNDEVATEAVTYDFTPGYVSDGIVQALSRISYGATPSLYADVRQMGFAAYLDQQLSPESIDDSFFESMNSDAILNRNTNSRERLYNTMRAHNLAHAAYSERQLQEVMGAFWSNHFHASNKDSSIYSQAIDDREFFRDNAFGKFEDLLAYSAASPLMSQFLDNDESRRGNINENYGREILELHTVGVDTPYGDEDVIAVSRIFTGWHYNRTNPNAEDTAALYEFDFKPDRHDVDDKVIPFLDVTIEGREGMDGEQEGLELIGLLANHPATQNYVCGKIVQKFVADQPPASFVETCVQTWAATDGDSREILRAILSKPEYISAVEYQRVKGKTPYEFAASVIRALGIYPAGDNDLDFYDRFSDAVANAGWVPNFFPVPTGLPEVGGAWTASATLIAQYAKIVEVIDRNDDKYSLNLQEQIVEEGLETAEEVAAYLLAIGTSDQYRGDEFDQIVDTLKGEDGIFEPALQDESDALLRAATLLVVTPSFLLQ